MNFSDTHCHLDFPDFDNDRDALLATGRERGVRRILIPGVTASQWPGLQRLAASSDALHYGLGLHPWFLSSHREDDLSELDRLLQSSAAVAVGEIGLHGPSGNMDRQVHLLEAQLELARSHQLPVILHQVGAHNELVRCLKRVAPPCGGSLHAFSGSFEMAQEYRNFGLHLGIGGVITYPRARKTRRAVARLPAETLVLETDGPDMPLCGFQGVRNSPLQIPAVFRALCALRGVTGAAERTELAAQLERNATAVFGAPPSAARGSAHQ